MPRSQKPAPRSSITKREQSDSHCLSYVAEYSQIYIAHGFVAEAAGPAPRSRCSEARATGFAPHWRVTKHHALDPRRATTKRYTAQPNRRRIAVWQNASSPIRSRPARIGAQSNLHCARLCSGGSWVCTALARNKAPCIRSAQCPLRSEQRDPLRRGF